jgi:hypothetical protein
VFITKPINPTEAPYKWKHLWKKCSDAPSFSSAKFHDQKLGTHDLYTDYKNGPLWNNNIVYLSH